MIWVCAMFHEQRSSGLSTPSAKRLCRIATQRIQQSVDTDDHGCDTMSPASGHSVIVERALMWEFVAVEPLRLSSSLESSSIINPLYCDLSPLTSFSLLGTT